jgi:hypothetical protein
MATSYADHITPREAVRGALRDHLRELVDASVQRIDVDAPLDPEAPGELDANGEPAKLWQNVPVITVKDLEEALRITFGEALPAPSEKTAEVATPATVFVAAECPRCHIAGRIPLAVTVELHQDSDGETLHLKPKSREALHTCGQLTLPQDADEAEQLPWDVADITGPAPTAREVLELVRAVIDEVPIESQPTFDTIEAWNDPTRREVAAWAQAMAADLAGQHDEDEIEVPPLPVVLGGTAPEPTAEPEGETRACPACGATLRADETHWSIFPEPMGDYVCPAQGETITAEETLEETAAPDEPCPSPGCILASYHDGLHDVPGSEDDLLPV